MKKICAKDDCSRPHWAKTFCKTHYGAYKMAQSTGQDTRICVACGRSEPEIKFQGYRKQCNSCSYFRYQAKHREHNLMKNYGITTDVYHSMLASQDGGCAICSRTTPGGRGNFFHVDHNHTTGKVRALLCAGCNMAIGHLREDPEVARRLADYLESHSLK